MLNWNLPETAQICETFSLFSFTSWSPDSNDDDEYNRLVYKLNRYAKIRKLLIIFFSTILRIIYIMIRNFELSSCKNILYQWKRNHLNILFINTRFHALCNLQYEWFENLWNILNMGYLSNILYMGYLSNILYMGYLSNCSTCIIDLRLI